MDTHSHRSIIMIATVANALADLCDQFTFVGGAVVPLYLPPTLSKLIRPTEDIDCVIEVTTRSAFYEMEKKLRSLGFKHDMSLICRWKLQEINVDVMPTEGNILGFSNRWYKAGVKTRIPYQLPSGKTIWIFSIPYFIAAKLEALFTRGKEDLRLSPDLEDVISILEGRSEVLEEIQTSTKELRRYLSCAFSKLADRRDYLESIAAHISVDPDEKRTKKVLGRIEKIISS